MTEGEKMVWAAAYAFQLMNEYELERLTGATPSVSESIAWAWNAVQQMREARQDVINNSGHGDVLIMLDEILED